MYIPRRPTRMSQGKPSWIQKETRYRKWKPFLCMRRFLHSSMRRSWRRLRRSMTATVGFTRYLLTLQMWTGRFRVAPFPLHTGRRLPNRVSRLRASRWITVIMCVSMRMLPSVYLQRRICFQKALIEKKPFFCILASIRWLRTRVPGMTR